MAMKRNRIALGIGLVLIALVCPPVVARTAATATPVPFPQAPASPPGEAEIQARVAKLEGFLSEVDRFIIGVHTTTERYRLYVEEVKQMLARCEVEGDVSGFEGSGFEGLVADGGRLCRGWVADFDQQARAYAARLDEAVAYQKLLEAVGRRVENQIEISRTAMRAKRIKRAVDEGMNELEQSRERMRPWMDSKDKNR